MPLALFGITNDGLNLAVNLIVLFLVVVWIALVVWTYLDARRRLSDQVLVAAATVASLFPFVGTIVYSILRPPEFLADKRERELEIRSAELRVRQLEEASCPNCSFPIERTYLRCPSCRARVKDPCQSCGKPIDPRWALCPYCETAVRRAAPPQAPGKRGGISRAKAPPKAAPSGERRRKPPAEAARRAPEGEKRSRPPAARQAAQRPARATKQRAQQKQRPNSEASSPQQKQQSSSNDAGSSQQRKAPAPAPAPAPDPAPAEGSGEEPRPAKT
jgi:hypothetical protein